MAKRNGPYCGGKLHGRDGTCTLPAGWGTEHRGVGRCRKHFGNAPNVIKAAERERLDHEVREALAALDVAPVDDPLTELQKLAGQVVAWKDAMAGKVNELTDLRYEGSLHGEQLRAEVALWERAMDRCERVLVSMARLNLDERLARISEAQGRLILAVMLGAFRELDLSAELQQALRPAVARQLRQAAAADRQRERLALAPLPSPAEG
jgi:hypothetical protein